MPCCGGRSLSFFAYRSSRRPHLPVTVDGRPLSPLVEESKLSPWRPSCARSAHNVDSYRRRQQPIGAEPDYDFVNSAADPRQGYHYVTSGRDHHCPPPHGPAPERSIGPFLHSIDYLQHADGKSRRNPPREQVTAINECPPRFNSWFLEAPSAFRAGAGAWAILPSAASSYPWPRR